MTDRPILLITRRLPPAVEARARRDYEVRQREEDTPLSADALVAMAEGAQGILCAPGDPLGAETIARLPLSVRILATFSVGTDHIAIPAAAERGIVVANTPEVLSGATAEIAMMLILMAARRASEGERILREGRWNGWAPTQLLGVGLAGKRLGILGMGRIGQELARMARGFGMDIHYHNRRRLPPEEEAGAVYHPTPESFLRAIEVLSMHIPGGEATRKWLNAERIALLPRGAIVVNTGRGSTVDDAALVAALHSGHIRAAGLDVYEGEPNIYPGYLSAPHVTLLPHLGSATIETRDAMGFRALDNLDAVLLRGQRPPFEVR